MSGLLFLSLSCDLRLPNLTLPASFYQRIGENPFRPSSANTMSDNLLALQAQQRILLLRGQKVMLDFHLAELYAVETRALKQAVRRNPARFPADFMFELNADKAHLLVSQNVIPGLGKLGGATPMAFTEQGVAMLPSVLRGDRAVQVNIATRPVADPPVSPSSN